MPTLAKGARQLVVQDALEMMGAEGSNVSQLTPMTYVGMSLPLAGAVMSTCNHRHNENSNVSMHCHIKHFTDGRRLVGGKNGQQSANVLTMQSKTSVSVKACISCCLS